VPPGSATSEAAALREIGASPLRSGEPRRIGPYVPLALLGSGGMGRVYLARPTDDSPGLVAVKVIRPEYADDLNFRRRFEREASVHARVRTAHTPGLCGAGFEDALLWMATEYLPGIDLADAVREGGALGTAAVWRLVAELGQALADLAAVGIVHRDLKPSNVLLCVSGAYLIDFGLSKAVDASALTGTGIRVGTPAFMSPEHLRTGRSDTTSDVFSLAGTLIYAATGRAPFGGGSGVDVMHRVAFEEPDAEVIGKIFAADPALGSLLSACLAKDPGRRPAPRDLIDTAAAHTGTTCWPEPLGGRARARQQAYEELCRLPAWLDARPPAEEDAPRTPPPSPPVVAAPVGAAGDAPGTPPEPLPAGVRASRRRKPVLAVAAGVTLCAVAAGTFVLTRPDTPGGTAAPGARVATAPTAPGADARASAPGGRERPSPSGGSAGGAAHPDGGAERPEVSGSPASDPPDSSPSPPAASNTPADISPSPTSSPSAPTTAAWITDCTHYSGNGRTGQGDSGKRVLQVQCMLTKRGYSVGSTGADGEFGPGTESAVRAFQSAKGLDADGVVGRQTWTALRDTA
jgi:tRNA A-37 threonylcarbamoyl transferase component Bud32